MTPRLGASLAMLVLVAHAASTVDLTECRQIVPAGEVAELRRDLDCAADARWPFSAEGIRLGDGATLEMNGFTIRGDGTGVGIGCFDGRRGRTTCTVHGPGTVSGFNLGMNGSGCRFVVRGVLLQNNATGILGPLACDLDAENVNVVDNAEFGIWAGSSTRP